MVKTSNSVDYRIDSTEIGFKLFSLEWEGEPERMDFTDSCSMGKYLYMMGSELTCQKLLYVEG